MDREQFKSNITFVLSMVATIIMLVTLTLIVFVNMDINLVNDKHFWTTTLIGTFLSILAIIFWLPSGKEYGAKDKAYISNKKAFDDKANAISNNQQFEKLDKFCTYKNEKRRYEKIVKMLNKVVLDVTVLGKFNDVESVVADTKLNKQQKKVLIHLLTKQVYVKELTSFQITTGIDDAKDENYRNTEKLHQTLFMIRKVVFGIFTSAFLASIIITEKNIGIAEITQLCLWLISIITNIFFSFLKGINLIRVDRNRYYIKMANLLCEFDEWLAKECPNFRDTISSHWWHETAILNSFSSSLEKPRQDAEKCLKSQIE